MRKCKTVVVVNNLVTKVEKGTKGKHEIHWLSTSQSLPMDQVLYEKYEGRWC